MTVCRRPPAIGLSLPAPPAVPARLPAPRRVRPCSLVEAQVRLGARLATPGRRRPRQQPLPLEPRQIAPRRSSRPPAGQSWAPPQVRSTVPAVRSRPMPPPRAARSPAAPSRVAPSPAARLRVAPSWAAPSWLPAIQKCPQRTAQERAPASTRMGLARREDPAAWTRRRRMPMAATPASCARSGARLARYRFASASRHRPALSAARSEARTARGEQSGSVQVPRRCPQGLEPSEPRMGRVSASALPASARFRPPEQPALHQRAGRSAPRRALSSWGGQASAPLRAWPAGPPFPAVPAPPPPAPQRLQQLVPQPRLRHSRPPAWSRRRRLRAQNRWRLQQALTRRRLLHWCHPRPRLPRPRQMLRPLPAVGAPALSEDRRQA
jgi:hypothetical protein